MQANTIGPDLAKNIFQAHGVDATGKTAITRQLRRGQVIEFFEKPPPCLIGMEACATAHHWARELTKLGHTVRLMPASYVKAYVKRSKNDAADAAAICEAVTRPSMRFVPVKTIDQQAKYLWPMPPQTCLIDPPSPLRPRSGGRSSPRCEKLVATVDEDEVHEAIAEAERIIASRGRGR